MDRNFLDLLQELRVLQTGTQILAGFLLTLPFQARFTDLEAYQRGLFLLAVALAVATTAVLVAPVSAHRVLFRHHLKEQLVVVSHRLTRVGLVLLGLTMATVLCLIVSVVLDDTAGVVAAVVAVVVFGGVWGAVPYAVRRAAERGA
ncbi:hypothetical protein SGUI_0309 [Serinicoccus hydrothermalis]|uniref:Sodium:proton antiporter n=1 Tax=Serinicoccus hydrothermalis TaxID=1758689 RepID=A0A1B1N8J3_9MICO|nr:DUF6328 family protein [Serinicoccus hydrothermalis]ANS77705.1 hypothetical protein SGUI_0309 [Serinicoccus hydrothermalis]